MKTVTNAPLGKDAVALAGLFLTSGTMHFVKPGPFEAMVPTRLPSRRALVYASGALEIACAVGLFLPRTRRVAGLASAALLVAGLPGERHDDGPGEASVRPRPGGPEAAGLPRGDRGAAAAAVADDPHGAACRRRRCAEPSAPNPMLMLSPMRRYHIAWWMAFLTDTKCGNLQAEGPTASGRFRLAVRLWSYPLKDSALAVSPHQHEESARSIRPRLL